MAVSVQCALFYSALSLLKLHSHTLQCRCLRATLTLASACAHLALVHGTALLTTRRVPVCALPMHDALAMPVR
eukprot:2230705-Rhodomonas_salina.2